MVNTSFDLNNPPQVNIAKYTFFNWDYAPVLFFVCRSATNPISGQCYSNAGQAIDHAFGGSSAAAKNVALLFTEQRTGLTKTLIINGNIKWTAQYIPSDDRSSLTGFIGVNGGDPGYYTNMTTNVYISANELKKLPFGGIWTAHLNLISSSYSRIGTLGVSKNASPVGSFKASITLNVTDKNHIQIYLPQYSGKTANVTMPIMPTKLGYKGKISAKKTIETCLYDGYSSNSHSFDLTFNSNNIDTVQHDFTLINANNPKGKSLHYSVLAANPFANGSQEVLQPNVTKTYINMNRVAYIEAIVPGVSTAVACIPWPITLKLKPFLLSQQPAGHYEGALNLTFTPSLNN